MQGPDQGQVYGGVISKSTVIQGEIRPLRKMPNATTNKVSER